MSDEKSAPVDPSPEPVHGAEHRERPAVRASIATGLEDLAMRLEEAQRAVLEDTERRVASIAAERLEKAALEFRERLEALAEQAVSNALGRLADERGEVAESAVERGGRMGMATRVEQEVARMILEAGQAMPARVDEPLHPE